MGRPRKQPETTEQEVAAASEPSGDTKTLTYIGPEGQINLAVGQPLVPGESYELPEELADQLVASSRFWEE